MLYTKQFSKVNVNVNLNDLGLINLQDKSDLRVIVGINYTKISQAVRFELNS